jgi:putative hydrolase of the HAD superfamily
MPIRVVLFDLWGTLVIDDRDEPSRAESRGALRARMAGDALAAAGMPYELDRIAQAFDRASEEHGGIHADGRDISAEARTVLYLRHLDETVAERLDEDGWRRMHNAILAPALEVPPRPIDGAVDALASVKSVPLPAGLISNAGVTPGYVLREILMRYGIWQHLDDAIFSDEVEMTKPTTAIFEQALDAFGVAPDEAVFVGDQPVLDVLGPQSAGIWTIQVGDLHDDGIEPHVRITSVADVMAGLRQLERVMQAADGATG